MWFVVDKTDFRCLQALKTVDGELEGAAGCCTAAWRTVEGGRTSANAARP